VFRVGDAVTALSAGFLPISTHPHSLFVCPTRQPGDRAGKSAHWSVVPRPAL